MTSCDCCRPHDVLATLALASAALLVFGCSAAAAGWCYLAQHRKDRTA